MTASPRDAKAAGGTVLHRLRRMQKRNLVLLLLAPLLVGLWLPLLRGKPARTVKPPTNSSAPVETPAAPAGEAVIPLSPIEAATAIQDRLAGLSAPFQPRWSALRGGEPFRPFEVVPTVTVADGDQTFTPTAIVLSTGKPPIAIIAGQTYRPGDSLGGRSIVAIEERRVVYREGNKTFAVPLPDPALRGDHD
ncbi:MAG: hypothetical protein JNK78_10315 [Planctomycetes bacterium]|nr:hypothetical protein [Planctomycetota bacterium]